MQKNVLKGDDVTFKIANSEKNKNPFRTQSRTFCELKRDWDNLRIIREHRRKLKEISLHAEIFSDFSTNSEIKVLALF